MLQYFFSRKPTLLVIQEDVHEFLGRLSELTEEVRSVQEIVTDIRNFLRVHVPQSSTTFPKTLPPLPSPIQFPVSLPIL